MKTKNLVVLLFATIAASIMFVSCTDNPSVSEAQQPEGDLADYTIIFYGHGGATMSVYAKYRVEVKTSRLHWMQERTWWY